MKRKLLTLLTLLLCAVGGAWGEDDPNFELLFQRVNNESAADGYTRLIKTYSAEGITLKCYSSTAGTENTNFDGTGNITINSTATPHFYYQIGGGTNALHRFGCQIASTKKITKVAYLICTNQGTASAIQPVLVGWSGDMSTTLDYYALYSPSTSINSTPDNAQWFTFDLSGSAANIKTVELYRSISKNVFTYNGSKISSDQGGGTTLRVWGVRVWTQDASVAPSTPSINVAAGAVEGLTDVTISSTNAEKVFYQWSDNSEAPTKGDASYTEAAGSSVTTKVPNATATKYLHTYGYNTIGTTDIVSRTYNVTKVQDVAGLEYATSSVSKAKSAAAFTNSLTNPNSLTVTYAITNNGTGSTINTTTGEVTPGSVAGVETVTVSSEATVDFYAGEATYTLIIEGETSDIVAVSPGYTFIADNVTSNGTVGLVAKRLYDSNHIFSPLGNTAANNKSKSTIGGVQYFNSLRVKNSGQDVLVFKVDRPCMITLYAQTTGKTGNEARGIKVGTAVDDNTYGTIPDSDPADGDHTITITSAGLVYLTGTGDRFIAGFEVLGSGTPPAQSYTTVYDIASSLVTLNTTYEGNTGTIAATTVEEAANAPELQVDATSGKLGKNDSSWAQINAGTVLTLPGVPEGATISFVLYDQSFLTINNVDYHNGDTYTATADGDVTMSCSSNGYIKSITVVGPAFITSSEPSGQDINVSAILNNESGTILQSSEMAAQGTAFSFGINSSNTRVEANAADAVVTISGNYYNDHGSTNVTVTVNATGNMKFTLGNCTYNSGTATLKNANNETIKTVDLSGTGCWKGSHTDITTFYYEGAAQTLTLSVSSYIPYIKVESVNELPKFTVTFKNGNETVETKQVITGEGLGTLPTPTYDSSAKYFVGWFTNTSDPGTKALASTVPTAATTYNALFIDVPTTTAGYYMPQNGVELYGLVSYLNSTNPASAKIFLKNGTYDWGTAAETQLTGSHISIIGESLDGTILSTIPAQEGLGEGTLLTNKGNYNYLQDLTLHNNYPYGNSTGRAASLKDEGNYTICKNVWLYSHQDTYYSHKSGGYFYFNGGKISGCVDYMCGQSRVYYDGVTLSNDNRTTYMTANSELYVFNNCTVENGGSTYYFGRAWGSVNGGPVCVFLNTTLKDNGSKLGSTRWLEASMNADYVIAGEYGTKNASGTDITPASNNVTFTKNSTSMNTILTAEQAATYTMAYTLGDWAATAASDVEQATVTDVTLSNNTLSWTGTSDAYLIEKDGEFVALTTTTTYDTSSAGMGTFTVRAANTRGGFGEAIEAETGGDAVKLIWTLATGTNATALSSTQTSTSDILNSATMTAISASTNDQAGKDNLTVKLNCGTAETAAATVTFTVPSGFAFIPHKTTAKVQPITYNAYVKLDVNGTATTATSFTQGQITTATLTESTERMLTGTVTIGIYVYDGASTGVTTYRLGSPITISGELVATVSTLAGRNYGTCVTGCGLDFTNVTDAKAYIATGLNSAKTAVVLQQVNKVATNTPLIIYTEEKTNAATVRVPITTDDPDAAVESNLLVAGDGTTQWNGTAGYTYYYIASDQFHKATSGTLQSGKAYLKIDNVNSGARLGFVFADEATSVSNVNRETITNNRYYDLQGRRIDGSRLNPGVYIKDGRKVVVK